MDRRVCSAIFGAGIDGMMSTANLARAEVKPLFWDDEYVLQARAYVLSSGMSI